MRKKTIAALALAAALGGTIGAAPAQAGYVTRPPADCGPGLLCAYQHRDWGGARWKWYGDDTNWNNDWNNGVVAANHATSLFNNGTPCAGCDTVVFFDEPLSAPSAGYLGCLHPGTGYTNLVVDWRSAENNIESHEWIGKCIG
ncbi:peptidase inhibitor family I36 protein [Longispora albida]|uniref:peptidase inhibitor family I36 protein n=1 Tax=Longispora albida TaxID=203523 RepID=UPI0003772839|nr:peptidase inhibitor family I36 protein [Longispora albida]